MIYVNVEFQVKSEEKESTSVPLYTVRPLLLLLLFMLLFMLLLLLFMLLLLFFNTQTCKLLQSAIKNETPFFINTIFIDI